MNRCFLPRNSWYFCFYWPWYKLHICTDFFSSGISFVFFSFLFLFFTYIWFLVHYRMCSCLETKWSKNNKQVDRWCLVLRLHINGSSFWPPPDFSRWPVDSPFDSQPLCWSFVLLLCMYISFKKLHSVLVTNIKACSCPSHTLRKHHTSHHSTNRPHRCFVLNLCTVHAHRCTNGLEAALSLAPSF